MVLRGYGRSKLTVKSISLRKNLVMMDNEPVSKQCKINPSSFVSGFSRDGFDPVGFWHRFPLMFPYPTPGFLRAYEPWMKIASNFINARYI